MSDGGAGSGLTSASVPAVGAHDHVRGEGPEVIAYLDLSCPLCAAAWARVRSLPLRICVRHFPLASKRPRALALHAAVEAAARQRPGAFWELWDSIYADQAHIDDPHLWERARLAGLDLARFDADRRSAAVADRVRSDFEGAIRAGVAGVPAAFADGRRLEGEFAAALGALASSGPGGGL